MAAVAAVLRELTSLRVVQVGLAVEAVAVVVLTAQLAGRVGMAVVAVVDKALELAVLVASFSILQKDTKNEICMDSRRQSP